MNQDSLSSNITEKIFGESAVYDMAKVIADFDSVDIDNEPNDTIMVYFAAATAIINYLKGEL